MSALTGLWILIFGLVALWATASAFFIVTGILLLPPRKFALMYGSVIERPLTEFVLQDLLASSSTEL